MRRLILTGLTIFFIAWPGFNANAIIEKNTHIIGGNIDMANITLLDDQQSFTQSRFRVNPVYGRFFFKNVAIGPFLSYEYQNYDDADRPQTNLDIGLYGRLYTGVNLFFEASVRYDRVQDFEGNRDRGGWTGVSMGYTVFLTDRLAIEPRAYVDFGLGGVTDNLVRTGFMMGLSGFLSGAGSKDSD